MLAEKIKRVFSLRRGLIITVALALVGVALLCVPVGGEKDGTVSDSPDSLSEYKSRLESELADACSDINGVGKCRVMITFEKGAENVYKGSQLIESTPPKVSGVTVICSGASDSGVRSSLTDMISALFGVGKNRIAVLELKK